MNSTVSLVPGELETLISWTTRPAKAVSRVLAEDADLWRRYRAAKVRLDLGIFNVYLGRELAARVATRLVPWGEA